MARLLLVEGIPGSGKTTTARWAQRSLAARGLRVALYCEGDPQPADLAWQWWFSPAEFEAACQRFPSAGAELRRCAWAGRAGVAVAYTKVDPERCAGQWADVEAEMADREPYNGMLPPAAFVDLLTARWAEFGASASSPDAPDVVIFDGAFLQDTLVELVLFADRDATAITADLRRLAEAVADWRPLLIRLVPDDPEAAVDAVARERVDADATEVWRDAVEAYVADTPWARARGLSAPGALLAYLTARQHVEAEVLPRLPLKWVDVQSPAGTSAPWQLLEERVAAALGGLARPPR